MGDVYCGEVVYEEGKIEYTVECGGIIGESVKITQESLPLTLCEVQVQGNNSIKENISRISSCKIDLKSSIFSKLNIIF